VGSNGTRFRNVRGRQVTTAPMNPLAGPAGPGKYSTRTDNLQMGSIAYGEGVETAAIKSGAPLAKTGDVKGMPSSEVRSAVGSTPSVGLYDESQNKSEPITAGIDIGAGPGSNALMMRKTDIKTSDTLAKMLPFDTDGTIAILYSEAVARGD
jgi:hypothetical protein